MIRKGMNVAIQKKTMRDSPQYPYITRFKMQNSFQGQQNCDAMRQPSVPPVRYVPPVYKLRIKILVLMEHIFDLIFVFGKFALVICTQAAILVRTSI